MADASLLAAGLTAFAAGVLSFLSPCVMPLMPAYLSFVTGLSFDELRDGSGEPDSKRARRSAVLEGSLGFVGGFSVVFVGLGASATSLGRLLRGLRLDVLGLQLTPVHLAGLVISVFGLHLTGLLRIPWLYRERRFRVEPTANFARALLLGAAFAFGWTPCIGPVLAGILTLAAGQETLWRGTFLLALYSAGLAIPFVAMAASLDRFYAVFGRVRRYFRAIEIGSGALLIGAGLLVMTGRLTIFNRYLSFMSDLVLGLEKWLL